MELTLDKAYRPRELGDIFGNTSAVKTIRTLLARNEGFPASILLQGPSGCGKTTLARIIARELDAQGRDLKEYNISDMRGIDAARSIIELVQIVPWGSCRVIVLNECHKATNEFQNAMLEVLEQPPPKNHFILCTTDPDKLLKTIKTRCTMIKVGKLVQRDMLELINGTLVEENVELSQRVIDAIIHSSDGSPRQALIILDALIELDNEKDQLAIAKSYYISEHVTWDLYQAIKNKKSWPDTVRIIKSIERKDAEDIRYALLALFEMDLFKGGDNAKRASIILDFFTSSFRESGRAGLTQACYFALHA